MPQLGSNVWRLQAVKESKLHYIIPEDRVFSLLSKSTYAHENVLQVGHGTKKIKPNPRLTVPLAKVAIENTSIGNGDRSAATKFPVSLEFHQFANDDYQIIINTIDGAPVMKMDVFKLDRNLIEIFKVVQNKNLEWEIMRRKQSTKDSNLPKKRKNRRAITESNSDKIIKRKYKDITTDCPFQIYYTDQNNWKISLELSLIYSDSSYNKFTTDTCSLLDTIFSEKDLSTTTFNQLSSVYIQQHFNKEIISYTRQKLALVKPTFLPRIPYLELQLLPFQMKSVQWMLDKETARPKYSPTISHQDLCQFLNRFISYGYEILSSPDSTIYFWNKFTNIVLTLTKAFEIYSNIFKEPNSIGAKGLLSEEMGLGKTVEVISLILLNKRLPSEIGTTFIATDNKVIKRSKTSLIICPNAILQQWINEIQTHSTNLSVFHYKGYLRVKKTFQTDDIAEIVDQLSGYDIIVTSYNTVGQEVHYAEYNAVLRTRRTQKPKYDYSSPLSLIQFFRIMLDEVQMLKSDSTKAAKCTSLLHRIHTWGISGTPIQLISDFQTVLSYLQIHPFQDTPNIIQTVATNVNLASKNSGYSGTEHDSTVNGVHFSVEDLMEIFFKYDICIRHTKHDVHSQIQIPKQHNFLIPLEFAPVEWDNYLDIWDNFISVSGYGPTGSGSPRLSTTQLNQWLTRLRYLCCHAIIPEGSERQKFKTLGGSSGSNDLHNINDVLKLMTMDAKERLDQLYRENFQLLIRTAQAKMELQNKPEEAVDILNKVKNELIESLMKKYMIDNPLESTQLLEKIDDDENSKEGKPARYNSIRSYMDLLHQCYFFIATGYYFMGSHKLEKVDEENEKLRLKEVKEEPKKYTDVYSDEEMKDIEHYQLLEQTNYETAEQMRQQILSTRLKKTDSVIEEVKNEFDKNNAEGKKLLKRLEIVKFNHQDDFSTSLSTSKCFKSLSALFLALNAQTNQLNDMMSNLLELSYKPIIRDYSDKDTSDNEMEQKAKEYSTSIDDQDKIFAILACLERLLANREQILSSDEEVKVPKKIKQSDQQLSDFHLELMTNLILVTGTPLKPIFDELRNSRIVRGITTVNRYSTETENNFEDYLLSFELEMTKMKKDIKSMRESLKRINLIYNTKLDYYSHLQRISDSLVSLIQLENVTRNNILRSIRGNVQYEENLRKISTAKSRLKYLTSLEVLRESIEQNKTFSCPICLGPIYTGSMIKCGHFFCKKCISGWLKNKDSCPMCKMNTSALEMYNFKFKDEDSGGSAAENGKNTTVHEGAEARFATFAKDTLTENVFNEKYETFQEMNEVNKLVIKESFGAKIDFMVKLLLYLKLKNEADEDSEEEQPQVVLYSQSMDYLKVISKVLILHDIDHLLTVNNVANVGETISKFKKNKNITCLLLNVKTLGAGLNLLNARHVFLLDPIINHGDELQAMSRNNRIGQTKETYVWNFMIKNSVEENIIKYKCFLESQKRTKTKRASASERPIEEDSDSDFDAEYEINESTGEDVSQKHIRNCLFPRIE